MILKKQNDRQFYPSANNQKFTDLLDQLYDIGAFDAVYTIQRNRFFCEARKQEDIRFYNDQKEPMELLPSWEEIKFLIVK